jgi:opine dehydrogenase
MTTEFSDLVAALGRPVPAAGASGEPRRVTVLGAGPEGRALAAWLLAEGTPDVSLFTVYADELAVLGSGSVTLRGDGPIGTYRTGDGGIKVTSVLDAAVADSDVLFVTGPVFKLRTYGMVLAPYLTERQSLVVCPAQTFGGLEVDWWLTAGGRRDASVMIEIGRVPFECEPSGGVLHLRRRPDVAVAARPAHRSGTLEWLQGVFPGLARRSTILHSSFADGSGLVEVPALVIGGPAINDGGPDLLPGAVPLTAGSFRQLITPRVAEMVSALADERRRVATDFGVRDLPSTEEWIDQVAGGGAPADSRPVPDRERATALVRQGVLGSLVPLVSAARLAGVPVPATQAIVQVVSSLVGADLASAGRRLETIGFADSGPDEVRRAVGVTGGPDSGR